MSGLALAQSKWAPGKAPRMVHDQAQELALVARIKDGDEAARELVELYSPRIRRTAEGYYHPGMHLEVEDLMQEGAIGLLEAARKYEPGGRYGFTQWVSTAISNSIRRAIFCKERPVRLPENIELEVARILKRRDQLEEELGRKPTVKEVARAVAANGEWFHNGQWGHGLFEEAPRQDGDDLVNDLIWIFNWLSVISLEEVRAESIEDLGDLAEEVVHSVYCGVIRSLVDRLPERERRVIELRFGLEGYPWRLEEIGQELGTTRERVRQRESAALDVLRQLASSRISRARL